MDSKFDFFRDDESGKWQLPLNICSLGGCYFNFLELDTEDEAREKAIELTKQGKEISGSSPCHECHNQYLLDCQ
ncbi:hypothetical protein Q0V21_30560 [Paenibacillus sp. 11B]|uniref:hypothetical protein n=1 Tax=Paenibacillus sp. 11B TaxID=3060965 RepID=UPI00264BF7AC|nr:hypothetical protein [Paenibacillus sp. 11B]MDN8593073.1 hypothetical protein [Paenibacillus sp. 11B]